MSRIAAVTGAACGDGDRHIVAAGQTRAAPADELIMIPCGIVQRDVVGLDGIAGGVFRRAAVQVVRNLILLQFAHEGRHIQAFVALQAQRIDGIRDLIARRNGVVAGANHDLRAGHGGAGIFCQKRAPVSYTHLDVYKRQVTTVLMLFALSASVPPFGRTTPLIASKVTTT